MTRHRLPVALALGFLVVVLAGCGKKPAAGNNGPSPGEPPPGPTAPAVASGPKGLFDQHCAKCHPSVGAAAEGGPRKGMKGPDLSHVGTEHDAGWIADHIRNPRGHKPQSRMPEFESKLSAEDIRALSEHLAAMK